MARIYLDTLNRRVLDPGVGKTGEPGDPGAPGDPGDPGAPGDDGAAASISIGTTTTLTPGLPATVSNSGTSTNAVLNFGIPEGQPGEGGSSSTVRAGPEDPNDLIFLDYPIVWIQTSSPHKIWKKNVGAGFTDIT